MSFNYGGYGGYLYVECDGSNICVYRNTGEIRKYKTDLGTVLPKQRIPFNSEELMWYMEDNDIFYVGRNNGTIAGFRKEDNLLVRLSFWTPPARVDLRDVGAYYYYTGKRVMLDVSDCRTCYVDSSEDEYIFNEPFTLMTDAPSAIAAIMRKEAGLHIHLITGEEVCVADAGKWFVSDCSRLGDKKRLL